MELLLHQEREAEPEPITITCNTTEGLLQSNYKRVANNNFKSSTAVSLFGMRQGLKLMQFNTVNHVSVILKLGLFITAIVTLF